MPSLPHPLSLDDLLAPVNGGTGTNLAFSALFDHIKEARRADPVYLTQGAWATDLKQANWDVVIELSAEGIQHQSKDLMLAGWLTEGLTQKHHFQGLTFGLELTDALLRRYWLNLFPRMDEGLDERAARLDWLGNAVSELIGELPLVQGNGYGLNQYDEALRVENLIRQNPSAAAAAQEEGKISAEHFQWAVTQTDTPFLLLRRTQMRACVEACGRLQASMDGYFGKEAPSLRKLDERLQAALQLIGRLLKERGAEQEAQEGHGMAPVNRPQAEVPADTAAAQQRHEPGAWCTAPISREEAFSMLSGAAAYFKQSEPQSPVPYLVERAIRWGRMPLEEWLKDVIKDNAVIEHIKTTLGTQ